MTGSVGTGFRALHYVLKIGDRKSAINFFKNVLGMKVLRHEEFEKGCEATCNGPYDGRWSKTMIGYGPEDSHFVLELTYNYGISSYRHGNPLSSIDIERRAFSAQDAERAEGKALPDGGYLLKNNGYNFRVFPDKPEDKIVRVNLLAGHSEGKGGQFAKFYESVLGMKVLNSSDPAETVLSYGEGQTATGFKVLGEGEALDRGSAFGRTAFSCPTSLLPSIQERVEKAEFEGGFRPSILTPLLTLDTPGKATVSVVIVADLSGHEICFVGAEAFDELSRVDPASDEELMRRIAEDKSDEWFAKHGKRKEEST